MAKTKETYKVVLRFIGSVAHVFTDSGEPLQIILDVNTDQAVLEWLYNKGYEGVTK